MVVAPAINAYAKEMAIRKRTGKIYNKRQEDFSSLREFNDYLEEVEDMIVNLIEGIDVPAIEARIAEYEKENAEQIMNAQAQKAEELAAAMAASEGQVTQLPVDIPSNSQAGAGTVPQGQYAPAIAGGGIPQPRPMGMGPQPIHSGLGDGFEYEDEETMKLRAERSAKAGGWSVEISKRRALEEAFASIWV